MLVEVRRWSAYRTVMVRPYGSAKRRSRERRTQFLRYCAANKCLNKCASLVSQDIKIGVNMDLTVKLPPAGKIPDMCHERVENA